MEDGRAVESGQRASGNPVVSLIVPCYNEAAILEHTAPPLMQALQDAVPGSEVVLVDNGSTDTTGAIIESLCARDPRYASARVPTNRGYGLGVLTGYEAARGTVVGHIPADGPVLPDEVARMARLMVDTGPGALLTAVRQDRQETLVRKSVSRLYNLCFALLFGRITGDINGTPKYLYREDWDRLRISSTDYFLEAEMMLKARRMGLELVPVIVRSQAREGGKSKVTARLASACFEFLGNLVRYRVGRPSGERDVPGNQ